MNKHFVRVLADINCEWEGLNPIYRVYVNDELFIERTWVWTTEYLEEMLQIEAVSGDYKLCWELVPPHLAQLTATNVRVDHGPGQIVDHNTLRISNESP
jgi:deoxyhypusine synthase